MSALVAQKSRVEWPAGKLLDAKGQCNIIVQQNNCVMGRANHARRKEQDKDKERGGAGLSQLICEKFPYGDPYSRRKIEEGGKRPIAVEADRAVPGTVAIFEHEKGQGPIIACLFAQWHMGYPMQFVEPKCPLGKDDEKNRYLWFKSCLVNFKQWIDQQTDRDFVIQFPLRIGCCRAGGNWQIYEKEIQDWTETLSSDHAVQIYSAI